MRHPVLHTPVSRIDTAQAHRHYQALDGTIRFAEPHFDPAAANPTQRQIRIDQQGSVKEGSAIIELSADVSKCVAREAECGSVVLTQLHSLSSQSSSFG